MKFGIWTPLPHTAPPLDLFEDMRTYGPGDPGDDTFLNFALDVIERADQFGFDVTLVAERFMGHDLEAWILATALAARTTQITVMPAVHPGIVTPQVVAKLAATLDRVSGGRAAINVVNGWWESEFANFSNGEWLTDPAARYRRMDEFVRVVRRLLTEESVTHRGEFYVLDDAKMPYRPVDRGPEIYGSSGSEPGRETLARYGDVLFLGPSDRRPSTIRGYAEFFDEEVERVAVECAAMKARAAEFGRTIRCGLPGMTIVGDSEAEALATVDVLDKYAQRGFLEAVSVGGTAIFGAPEQIEKKIRALDDAGLDLLLLKFAPMRLGLEQFGVKVLPLLQDIHGAW